MIDSRALPSRAADEGFYFRSFQLSETRGLLLSVQDQSFYQGAPSFHFVPAALEGIMPNNVAASLYDRILQLR